MTETTVLDLAHRAMQGAPDDDAARLAFFHRLADTELFLLLDADPGDGPIAPQVFALEEGRFVLAFDLEERLAAFTDAPAPYAALPGRVVAAALAGQGVGLGLNLGVAPSGHLLPPAALDWLAGTLQNAPRPATQQPEAFLAPGQLPQALVGAIAAKLEGLAGLAERAGLAAVRYCDGRQGHLFAFLGAVPGAEPGLAKAISEALTFSGIETASLDVTFLPASGAASDAFLAACHPFPIPAGTQPPAPDTRTAPGPAEPRVPNLRGYRSGA